VGENGNFHWQGFLCFDEGRGLTLEKLRELTSDLLPGAHFEPMRGSLESNIEYCSCPQGAKSGDVISPFVSVGEKPAGQGKRMDLVAVANAVIGGATVEALYEEYPSAMYRYGSGIERHMQLVQRPRNGTEDIQVLTLVGPTGVGKSRLVRDQFPGAYWKPASNKWWPNYIGQKVVVFDDFRGNWFPYELLLRILDRYDCDVENKGGSHRLLATVFIITTNREPDEWYDEGCWKNTHCRTWESSALSRRLHQNGKCHLVRLGEIPRMFEGREIYLPYPRIVRSNYPPVEPLFEVEPFGVVPPTEDELLVPELRIPVFGLGSQISVGASELVERETSSDLEWEPCSQDADNMLKTAGTHWKNW